MARTVLTLTTDFGLADHYVAAMKGVILGIAPDAQIVDISHEVTPFAIEQGAYLIAQSYGYFPKRTVHVVVVDPGVGSQRRPLVMQAAGQYFVGPDNGVFSMVMAREKHRVRTLSNAKYFRHPVSRTFHGRDIFAPVAAHIASGGAAARMGETIGDPVLLDLRQPRVLHIDRFGNIVTSLRTPDFAEREGFISINGTRVSSAALYYSEFEPGELFALEGSSGYIEVSTNRGSAADLIGCRPGDAVRLVP
jgi:S-adenosyl-L-methionine hydrolase (adenosine-forming)